MADERDERGEPDEPADLADASVSPSSGTVDELFDAARAVRAHAHVPYSRFPVGAALRTTSGRVFVGTNVENAAYPEGTCAEAGAISAMVAAGEREISEIVTVCGDDDTPATPPTVGTCCGGCRQKIREFAIATTRVHNADPFGIRRTFTVDELLPGSFGPGQLPDRDR